MGMMNEHTSRDDEASSTQMDDLTERNVITVC